MGGLFVFFTTAFPKAGIQLGAVPLTVSIVLLVLLVLRSANGALKAPHLLPGYAGWYGALLLFGGISLVIAMGSALEPYLVAQRVVVLASPLALIALQYVAPDRSARIVAWALVITSLYAAVQFAFGVTAASVGGVTYTFGQELAMKTIGYSGEGDTASKMPSTYQVGNSLGIFCALGLGLMASAAASRLDRKLRLAALVAGVLGLLLCGSRSIIIPIALGAVVIVATGVRRISRTRQQVIVGLGLCAAPLAVAYVAAAPNAVFSAFWQRNVLETLSDPTATGRTDTWRGMWATIATLQPADFLRLVLVGRGSTWSISGGEGLPAFLVDFGLPATIAFYGGLLLVVVVCWHARGLAPVAIALCCALFAFIVDTSFYYPPNLMNFFLIAGIALRLASPDDLQPQPGSVRAVRRRVLM